MMLLSSSRSLVLRSIISFWNLETSSLSGFTADSITSSKVLISVASRAMSADTTSSLDRTKQHLMQDEIKVVSPIPEHHYSDVINHLRLNFFPHEPMNKSIGLCQQGEPHPEMEAQYLETLQNNLSVMLFSKKTNQVVGVGLNEIFLPGEIQKQNNKLKNITDLKLKKILTLINDINKKLDLFNEYKVDKIFYCQVTSVDSNYRDKGFAKELQMQGEAIARENNIKMIQGDPSGLFMQRILSSLGYNVVYEIKYADYIDEKGQQIFKTSPPDDSLKKMIRILE